LALAILLGLLAASVDGWLEPSVPTPPPGQMVAKISYISYEEAFQSIDKGSEERGSHPKCRGARRPRAVREPGRSKPNDQGSTASPHAQQDDHCELWGARHFWHFLQSKCLQKAEGPKG